MSHPLVMIELMRDRDGRSVMVAVAYPTPHGRGVGAVRPVSRLRGARMRSATSARYRRRRLGVGSLALTMLLAGWAVVGSSGDGPLSVPEPAAGVLVTQRVHVVQPGDTLWSIARSLQPDGDVRRLVHQLAAQRRGAALQVGERVVLP